MGVDIDMGVDTCTPPFPPCPHSPSQAPGGSVVASSPLLGVVVNVPGEDEDAEGALALHYYSYHDVPLRDMATEAAAGFSGVGVPLWACGDVDVLLSALQRLVPPAKASRVEPVKTHPLPSGRGSTTQVCACVYVCCVCVYVCVCVCMCICVCVYVCACMCV
jgi:hypothetical protein